jgi:hypothetical protein
MNKRVGCSENAGEMDRIVAKGLGLPVEEYVEALIGKRVQSERLEIGAVYRGVTLKKPRFIFRYQGRETYLELDD